MILAADNLQVTNKTIETALNEMNPEPIREMAIKCEKAGAQALDLNSGPLGRDAEKKMTLFVEAVQDVSDLPILIDTANPSAMEAGLRANKKTAIINGFSLQPQKLEAILPLAKKYQSDIIGYLLYPNGHVPPDATERLSIAAEIYNEAQKAGIDKEHLIIDPIVVPLTWQKGRFQAMELLTVLRTLPEVLDYPVRTIVGLSNLIIGRGYREKRLLLERAYLPMLAACDLSIALLNIFHHETVRIAKACISFSDPKVFSWEAI